MAKAYIGGGEEGIDVSRARRVAVPGRADVWLVPSGDRVCMISTDPKLGTRGGFTSACRPRPQVATGALFTTWISGADPATGATTIFGVVPDGVRRVAILDDDGATRTVPVHRNVYAVRGGRARWVEFDAGGAHHRTRV